MRTKYIHLRHKLPNNVVLPNGGMTVAYIEDEGIVLGFAPSKCHSKDNYNKQQGRVKAEGRLKSSNYFTQTKQEEKEFLANMNKYWEEEGKLPGKKTPACCGNACRCSSAS